MKKILFGIFVALFLAFLCFSASADYRYENGVMTFYGSETISYSFMPKVPEGESVHTIVVEEGVKYLTFGNTFGPDGTLTRAQIAKIVALLMD